MSEEKRLELEKDKTENKEDEKENNNDKNTEISNNAEDKTKKEEIQKIEQQPFINIRKISTLSDSVINYFAISISLFIYSAYNLGWFDLKEQEKFIKGYYIFAGISLYIIGILNWYEGKELLFLFDFVFSFFFIILFLNGKLEIKVANNEQNDKLEGIFYIIFFALILIIGISAKEKGIIFIINYAVLFVGFVFLFADKFFGNNKWLKYVYCYDFIVSAAILWVTGIFKLVNNCLNNRLDKILRPTD